MIKQNYLSLCSLKLNGESIRPVCGRSCARILKETQICFAAARDKGILINVFLYIHHISYTAMVMFIFTSLIVGLAIVERERK